MELLGNCDVIVTELCSRLGEGWNDICGSNVISREISRDEMTTPPVPSGSPSPEPSAASPKQNPTSSQTTHTGPQTVVASISNSKDQDNLCNVAEVSSSTELDRNTGTAEQQKELVSPIVTTTCTGKESSNLDRLSTGSSDHQALRTGVTINAENTANHAHIPEVSQPSEFVSGEQAEPSASSSVEPANSDQNTGVQNSSTDNEKFKDRDASRAERGDQGADLQHNEEDSEVRDIHEEDDRELAMLRASWEPRRINLSARLPGTLSVALASCNADMKCVFRPIATKWCHVCVVVIVVHDPPPPSTGAGTPYPGQTPPTPSTQARPPPGLA